jgi:hypothetical protein
MLSASWIRKLGSGPDVSVQITLNGYTLVFFTAVKPVLHVTDSQLLELNTSVLGCLHGYELA